VSLVPEPITPLRLQLPSPLTELHDARLARAGVRVHLKRDDLIAADITGNKWRKLRDNRTAAREQAHGTLRRRAAMRPQGTGLEMRQLVAVVVPEC
jgi:hypothetical protein